MNSNYLFPLLFVFLCSLQSCDRENNVFTEDTIPAFQPDSVTLSMTDSVLLDTIPMVLDSIMWPGGAYRVNSMGEIIEHFGYGLGVSPSYFSPLPGALLLTLNWEPLTLSETNIQVGSYTPNGLVWTYSPEAIEMIRQWDYEGRIPEEYPDFMTGSSGDYIRGYDGSNIQINILEVELDVFPPQVFSGYTQHYDRARIQVSGFLTDTNPAISIPIFLNYTTNRFLRTIRN
ncbi:MAG: hypothetical protein AAFY36_12540 [Bacteroidota bacterium]